MNILVSDIKKRESFLTNNQDDITIISDTGKIKPCRGCFDCWIKTPGRCVLNDGYNNMGELLSKCDRLIIVSRCIYGGYSPFVKNVLDRSISYLLPYFQIENGITCHQKRYDNSVTLIVHFYGDISDAEKETARELVKTNGSNLFEKTEIYFYKSIEEIRI